MKTHLAATLPPKKGKRLVLTLCEERVRPEHVSQISGRRPTCNPCIRAQKRKGAD